MTLSQSRPCVIITNIKGVITLACARGEQVASAADGPIDFARQCRRADLVILDNAHWRVFLATLLRPIARFSLISVDLILRPPVGLRERITAKLKALALSQVDKFILYFKDTAGYQRHYRIRAERIVYVPFKPNGREETYWPSIAPDGQYVLCAGRTLRDLATFVKAMASAGCPGILLQQPADIMREHGTEHWHADLPANLKLVIHEDGKLETFLSFIANAKIVVIPRYNGDIASTGISTYLMAMALGKCVVISRGPGVDDLLTDEAAIVAPEDADMLANTISRLWNDDRERRRIASSGKKYADSLGDTSRLCADILAQSFLTWRAERVIHPADESTGTPGCVDIG